MSYIRLFLKFTLLYTFCMLLKLITEGSFTLAEALFTLAASTPYTVLGYIFVLLFVLFFLFFFALYFGSQQGKQII